MKARAVAALIVKDVIQHGQSLNTALPNSLSKLTNDNDRGFTQELCYGVMRWMPRLQEIAKQLLKKPLKKKDSDVYALVLCGLYQLLYMRVPEHAAVGETAAAAKQLKKAWAVGLVNGVLRNFLREKDQILKKVDALESAYYAYPNELLSQIKQDWPDDWRQVLQAGNERPPMVLRINQLKVSRQEYLRMLVEANIEASAFQYNDVGIVLASAVDVTRLPKFDQGYISVQDGGAQLAADVLDVLPGQRVLDACAAPGGKTCHLLEQYPQLEELVVLDKEGDRLQRVKENLERLDLHAKVLVGDARDVSTWWDGQLFDRILLDVPCSASGVIRRHPDIKQLRTTDDFQKLAQLQREILDKIWDLLKPGGILLYATCSICHLENQAQVRDFLAKKTEAEEIPIEQQWGRAMAVGRQILPGDDGMDGFYYARLKKR